MEQTPAGLSPADDHTSMGVPRRLTLVLAGLMAAQALIGLAAPNLYRDVEWIGATWFGNDCLTLVVVVPLLLISGRSAGHGSSRALLLWTGGIGYAVYNYAFYLLGAALNVFFPLYVALVVLAAVMLILTLRALDASAIALKVRPAAPVPLLGGSFLVIGLGLAVVWTAMWASYVFAGRPTPVDPDTFRLIAALDLSLMAPALVSGGVLLWRRAPWGPVIAAIAGIQGSLYLAVLSVNSLIAMRRGLAVWPGEFVIWAPLAALTTALTWLLLSSVSSERPRSL